MSQDPYRYFRIEAQELLESLSRGLLELEKPDGGERVRGLLRRAHTFKGAARVVKQTEIGELAHGLEDLLSPHRDGNGSVPQDVVDRALDLLDRIRERMRALGAPPAPEGEPRPAPSREEPLTSVRIGISDLDAILAGLDEAAAAAAVLERDGGELDEAVARALDVVEEAHSERRPSRLSARAESLLHLLRRARRGIQDHGERVEREIARLREIASELRLVPAESLLTDLERATRDAAQSLGKRVVFRAAGAETRIDAHVLSGVRAAMLHLVRNAVAHGIEEPAARAAAGKAPEGVVEVSIERRGHRVALRCGDDGRGLDVDSLRRAAFERGRISEAQSRGLDAAELVRVLLQGGISTAPVVNAVSGRGVGLDVVRAVVEELKGEVAVETTGGVGTAVSLIVPVSLSALPALVVEVDGTTALIPLDNVRRTLRIEEGAVSRTMEGERIVVEESVVPFLSLGRALRKPEVANDGGGRSAVVLETAGGSAALGVDRVRGVRNVLVRSLPEHAPVDRVVAAAAFDEEGVPQPVLLASALVEMAREAFVPSGAPVKAPRPPLLVIDDSLTTRMLEQSILESAGYDVDLAVSAEEALVKARARRYGLFIVDVEMPGMDGFGFIAETRADPELKSVPSILVTSRANAEDKRRGKDVGARAYIVKSEFDQEELLSAIRSLVG